MLPISLNTSFQTDIMPPNKNQPTSKKNYICLENLHSPFPKEAINRELINACMNKEPKLVEKLLDLGASINAEVNGNTPLFAATYVGEMDTIKIILKKNPDMTQPAKIEYSNFKNTPLIEATWLAFYSPKKTNKRMRIVNDYLKYILDKEKNESVSPFKEPQKALNEGLYCSAFFKLEATAKEFLKVGAHLQALSQCQDPRFTELLSRISYKKFVVSKSKVEKYYSQLTLKRIFKMLKTELKFPKHVIKIFKEYYGNFNLTAAQLYHLECNEKFLYEKQKLEIENTVEKEEFLQPKESGCNCIVS